MKKFILPIGLSFFLFACGGEEETSQEKSDSNKDENIKEDAAAQEACTYSYNNAATEVSWIAFKLADKQAVNGDFLKFDITGTANAASVPELINSLTGTANLQSVSTNDTLRDWKIEHFFFGNMTDSTIATARVVNASYTSADLILTLNGVEKTIPSQITYKEGELSLECEINVMDFNAQEAHSAINKACEEKHKGNGDEAVTWPDVKIVITTVLDVNCDPS
jgi:hypothetical protein